MRRAKVSMHGIPAGILEEITPDRNLLPGFAYHSLKSSTIAVAL